MLKHLSEDTHDASKTPSLLYGSGMFGRIEIKHKLEKNAANAHARSTRHEKKISNFLIRA